MRTPLAVEHHFRAAIVSRPVHVGGALMLRSREQDIVTRVCTALGLDASDYQSRSNEAAFTGSRRQLLLNVQRTFARTASWVVFWGRGPKRELRWCS